MKKLNHDNYEENGFRVKTRELNEFIEKIDVDKEFLSKIALYKYKK